MLVWLGADQDKGNLPKRLSILLGFGALQGMSLGGFIELLLDVDPSILVTAFLGTVTVFVCFSLAALMAKRREYLYLGGILGSMLSVLSLMNFINLFTRSPMMFDASLYLGLAMFCGYVIFDTQVIVEKAALGDRDVCMHAAGLFIDLVAIFVRIAIILLKNKEGDKKKKSNRR